MQQTDFTRFRDLMRGMGRIFGQEPDHLVMDAYWLALNDWPLDQFEAACAHLMQTSEFMPRPAAFTALRKAARPLPAEAWNKALEHCASGVWRKGPLGDPAVDSVVAMLGGYEVVALCDLSKLGFLERRFTEHFESVADVTDTREAVPMIAGRVEELLEAPVRSLARIVQ